jgi:hypothetical protein
MGQAAPQVPLPLLGAVAGHGVGMGGAIGLPVAGVLGAPFLGAVAADLTILRIGGQFLLAAEAAALLLTGGVPASRVKARQPEQHMTKTALPMVHLFRMGDELRAENSSSEKPATEKNDPARQGYPGGHLIRDWPVNWTIRRFFAMPANQPGNLPPGSLLVTQCDTTQRAAFHASPCRCQKYRQLASLVQKANRENRREVHKSAQFAVSSPQTNPTGWRRQSAQCHFLLPRPNTGS